ncbi:MAG TPA: helix-turn-helix transcriptional regulator [Pseudonocardiaceae bacterium]
MLSSIGLASRPAFQAWSVTCHDNHTGWSQPEVRTDHRLVLVRRGRFRRQASGVTEALDPTVAYLGVPGEEELFAHPSGGDECTSTTVTPELWQALAGDSPVARPSVYVDARLDLAHRRFVAAARDGDVDYAMTEHLLALLATALAQVAVGPIPATDRPADRAVVAAAREAVAADHPASAGLLSLADLLGVSPYRLSRAFTRELGVSLTRYRNRIRVGRAVDRIADGETSLGALAADLGFADQAHLTRTVRGQLGCTPSGLRTLLTHSPSR